MAQNITGQHVLGSGEVHFAPFLVGTTTPGAFKYLGNTTEFNLTPSSSTVDHFDADHGVREKDDSVLVETGLSGSIMCDNINKENLARFFLGTSAILSQSSLTSQVYTITSVEFGTYKVGMSDTNPSGFQHITVQSVTDGAQTPTTYTAGDDYVLDLAKGEITIVEGGAITAGTQVVVNYGVSASTREQIISGNEKVEGALMFKAYNPKGPLRNYLMPKVMLTPNGDLSLKTSDWQMLGFTVDVQRKGSLERVYVDGVAIAS